MPLEPVERLIETWDAGERDCQKICKGERSLEQNKRLRKCTKLSEKGCLRQKEAAIKVQTPGRECPGWELHTDEPRWEGRLGKCASCHSGGLWVAQSRFALYPSGNGEPLGRFR